MPINVNNPQADALTRRTAARLRAKHGVILRDDAKAPLPKDVFDEMWGRP